MPYSTAPLHHCTTAPLHSTAPLHHCTTVPQAAAIRCVTTSDFMTADWYPYLTTCLPLSNPCLTHFMTADWYRGRRSASRTPVSPLSHPCLTLIRPLYQHLSDPYLTPT